MTRTSFNSAGGGVTSAAAPGLALRALDVVLGLCLVAAVGAGVSRFPVAQAPLGAALVVYAALLAWRRDVWIVVLPALLPVLYLAPWTGRYFLDEFDLLVLATIAVLRLRPPGNVRAPETGLAFSVAMGLLVVSHVASAGIALQTRLPFDDPNAFDSYLSPYNALRVAKGFAWAWLLAPHLRHALGSDLEGTENRLTLGVLLGLVATGVGILWERGILDALVHWSGVYGFVDTVLDFSGSYRATGLFFGMHVGGTAIDGYLVLVLPFAAAALISDRGPVVKLLALAAFALGTYGLLVTFSRGAYVAFALSMALLAAMWVWRLRREKGVTRGAVLAAVGLLAAGSGVSFALYAMGGYEAIAGAVLALVGGAALTRRTRIGWWPLLGLAGVALAAGGFAIQDAVVESKWNASSPELALAVAAGGVAGMGLVGAAAGGWVGRRVSTVSLGLWLAAIGVIWIGVVPAISGYRMETRFSASKEDSETRVSHWRDTVAMGSPQPLHRAFGMGLGTFPARYFSQFVGRRVLANYRFERDREGTYLQLGSGDFNLMQRVAVAPRTRYRAVVEVRSRAKEPVLAVKLCLKHYLYSDRWQPQCQVKALNLEGNGEWERRGLSFDSGRLGARPWTGWPVTLMLSNARNRTVIDIRRVSLVAPSGEELVANGDFADGHDRWFMVSDFLHLAWHAKNLYLHVWFEQGWLGVLALLALLVVTLGNLARRVRDGSRLAMAGIGGLVGLLALGTVGTVIDMPRVAMLFYLVCFWGAFQFPSPTAPARGRNRFTDVNRTSDYILDKDHGDRDSG